MGDFREDLSALSTAEEFLDFFGVPFDPQRVAVNRLHILQRFHDYLAAHHADALPEADALVLYRRLLRQAYQDFVESDPLRERVFRVLRDADGTADPARRRVPLPTGRLPVRPPR